MSTKKLIFILIAATFLSYFSSLNNPFIWDDEQFITSNVYVQNFDLGKIFTTNTVAGAGVASNYYRPLTTLSFALDTKLWGQNTFGFHLVNLLLHILAGLLLFVLLAKLGIGKWPRFFISLIFLIHPIQTEAVTYINSRGDSLYTVFLFASLLLFTVALEKKQNILTILGRKVILSSTSIYFGSVILFIFSLLSKEIALAGIGLYIIIFLLHLFQTKHTLPNTKYHTSPPLSFRLRVASTIQNTIYEFKPVLITFLALFLVVCFYIYLRLTVLRFGNILNYYGFENDYTKSLWIRLFTFAKVVWIYLGLLIFPYPLHMERTVEIVKSFFSPWVLSAIAVLLISSFVGVLEIKKNRSCLILFGILWFFIMLIPGSGIIPVNGILYEHWLYVPSIGLWLMAYGIGKLVYEKLPNALRPKLSALVISFATLLCILYGLLTIRQNNIWSDPIQFYRYTLSFTPSSARLHNNLALSLGNVGQVPEAIVEYKKALQLTPGYPQIYNNLGNSYFMLGQYAVGEQYLKKALQMSPDFTVARINLIKLYVTTKQFDKAIFTANGDQQLINAIQQAEKLE